MAQKLSSGTAMIAFGGGPSPVVNKTLSGLVLELQRKGATRILGARHGAGGLLSNEFYELHLQPESIIAKLGDMPGMALGTSRKKLKEGEPSRIVENLKAEGVRYLYYIGGDDTASIASVLHKEALEQNYEMACLHVAKTIDNDLTGHDRSPGYGSSALYLVRAVAGIEMDNRALPGVHIAVTMGKNCGFLAASAALAKASDGSGPHRIYVPEQDFSLGAFLGDVQEAFSAFGRAVMVVSEGISVRDGDGRKSELLAHLGKAGLDDFGRASLSGTGALGDFLAGQVRAKLGIERARTDTFGYSQRSFFGLRSRQDVADALLVGREAVRYTIAGWGSGSVALTPLVAGQKPSAIFVSLDLVGTGKRQMPSEFLSQSGCGINLGEFRRYALPLIDYDVPQLVELGQAAAMPAD